MLCEQTIRQCNLGTRDSHILGFMLDVHGMNVTLTGPDLVVDDDARRIMVERNGEKITIQYGDLQSGDKFYLEDNNGQPKRYRVIDISGTPDGNCEITTEVMSSRLIDYITGND